jgi:hypothetical protein
MKIAAEAILVLSLLSPLPARAQYGAITLGGQVGSSIVAPTAAGGQTEVDFEAEKVLGLDFGWGPSRYFGFVVHYSHATPEVTLRRGDAIGSSATADVSTHTLTLDGRIHSPTFARFRLYGFVGGGLSRFNVDIQEQVELPFPDGVPDSLVAPVLTYGGGVERIFFPYLRWRMEVRNDVSALPEEFVPGDHRWNRTQAVAGLVIGR